MEQKIPNFEAERQKWENKRKNDRPSVWKFMVVFLAIMAVMGYVLSQM